MLYQIQKYNTVDYNQREIVAQSQELNDVAAINKWVSENTPSTVEDGFAIATVPQEHAWYAHVEPVVEVEPVVVKSCLLEGPCSNFAAVAKYELERGKMERAQLHEQFLAQKNSQ